MADERECVISGCVNVGKLASQTGRRGPKCNRHSRSPAGLAAEQQAHRVRQHNAVLARRKAAKA